MSLYPILREKRVEKQGNTKIVTMMKDPKRAVNINDNMHKVR